MILPVLKQQHEFLGLLHALVFMILPTTGSLRLMKKSTTAFDFPFFRFPYSKHNPPKAPDFLSKIKKIQSDKTTFYKRFYLFDYTRVATKPTL